MNSFTALADYRLVDLAPKMKRSIEIPLTPDLLNQFIRCSGDINPLHASAEAAQTRGFSHRVIHGMLLGALLSRFVGCHLPGRRAFLLSTQMKFHRPCLEGEVVRVEGTVESVSAATRTVSLALQFTVGGELRASATALVAMHES